MIKDHPAIFQGNPEAFLTSKRRFFACPVDHTRNILAFSFAPGKGHPFTEGMVDDLNTQTISADHTHMALFYERFQPKNLLEALFETRDHPLLRTLAKKDLEPLIRISSKTYLVPWVDEAIPMGGFGKNMSESEGSHYLGPVSQHHLSSEFERIKTVVSSIQLHGFNVDKQTDTIRGYFLFHANNYVCVIVGGNHRVGALAALNSPSIPVELHPERPPFVTLNDLHRWPGVKNGTFSPALAEAMFLRFFSPPHNCLS